MDSQDWVFPCQNALPISICTGFTGLARVIDCGTGKSEYMYFLHSRLIPGGSVSGITCTFGHGPRKVRMHLHVQRRWVKENQASSHTFRESTP